ncbi:unnamed protein product [Adineta ricciae]|uniref:NHL repeat containing protein n=1 Tax=Adineta ricciae TaxID=249248 RepID=A0A815TRJ4_ADIRI|nr:unnamed protein product [Adineta ricciae]
MEQHRIRTGKVRVEKVSRRDRSTHRKCSTSLTRITSVKHISIRSANSVRSSSPNRKIIKDHHYQNNSSDHIFDKSEQSSVRSTNTVNSVRVTKVQHVPSVFRPNPVPCTNSSFEILAKSEINLSQNEISSEPTKSIKKPSLGTIENLITPLHQDRHLSKQKSLKTFMKLCCRCTRKRALLFLICVILFGVLLSILLIILLPKSKSTSNQTYRKVYLRWNTTGITIYGTTGLRGNTSTQLSSPFGLIFDSDDNLYIGDRYNHRVQKCSIRNTSCITIAGQANAVSGTNMSDLNGPTYLFMDANNNLYIADSGNQRIQFWTYGANYGKTIAGVTGSAGSGLNYFNIPYDVALDSRSNAVYVSDHNNHRVMKYVFGNLTGSIVAGGNGFGTNNTQLYRPAGLVFDSSTNALIVVNFGATNIVQWKLGDSKWTIVAGDSNGLNGNTSTLLDHPTGVTYDPIGNMYVADMFNHRIQMYSIDQSNATTIVGVSGQLGTNSAMLNYPVSVAFDHQLNLYVADSLNHRIQKFLRY